MKVIRNNIIPFRGFVAINIFGVVFVRNDYNFASDDAYNRLLRHEAIHTKQMQELGYLPFYLLYLLEWFVRWAICRDATQAYYDVSFEGEAYDHQYTPDYLSWRGRYAFLQYMFKRR